MEVRNPLPQSVYGINFLDAAFPHRFSAKTAGQPSLIEALADDDLFGKVIKYIIDSGRVPTEKLILHNLRFNINTPSHFFPSAAAALYNEYARGKDVYDPFVGWGGRTLAAYCTNVKSITGTDLQEASILGCGRISQEMHGKNNVVGRFFNQNCLSYMQSTSESFDFIFSSPPFLDSEKYGNSQEHSSTREWVESFVIPFVRGMKRVLRPGGVAGLHLQDRRNVPALSLFLAAMSSSSFKVIREFKYGKTSGQIVLIVSL
jgi:16S rRNA G966 N2-methylase RsmD